MDEKRGTQSKKLNIKNKKAAAKALNKSSNKKINPSKKNIPKKNITSVHTEEKLDKELIEKEIEIIQVNKKEIKPPKEKKVKEKNEIKEKKITTKKATTKKTETKKTETKKKTSKKQPEKTKLVLPKEWQKAGSKNKEEEEKGNFSSRLKSSIFEELDDKTFRKKKKEEKEQLKKSLITFLIIASSIAVIVFILVNYNDYVKKQLAVYDVYQIGDKIKLKDDSIWYVIEDSDSRNENVKLLRENLLDLNDDTILDGNDTLKYNSNNFPDYDLNLEDSVGHFLFNNYKLKLQESVGKIESISLLTSKEYVKIRNKMGFGYEWGEGNWLANENLKTWWIISKQNEKVYCVTPNGTYKLQVPNSPNYVRPTIIIKKAQVEKVIEIKDEEILTNALINFFN